MSDTMLGYLSKNELIRILKADIYEWNWMRKNFPEFIPDLSCAEMIGFNLVWAKLNDVLLPQARLIRSNLRGANLNNANLMGADLREAVLIRTSLKGADLGAVKISGADLSEADLENVKNWMNIGNMKHTNIYGVKNAPDGFYLWALEHGAIEKATAEFERE